MPNIERTNDETSRRVLGDVRHALARNLMVPHTIHATIDNGVITLTGTAKYHYQRQEAELAARNIHGVIAVRDEVTLTAEPRTGDQADQADLVDSVDSAATDSTLADSIERALRRDIRLHLDDLTVTSVAGTVTLSGVAHSWPEHDAAIAAAWDTPGVRHVVDQLIIRPDES